MVRLLVASTYETVTEIVMIMTRPTAYDDHDEIRY